MSRLIKNPENKAPPGNTLNLLKSPLLTPPVETNEPSLFYRFVVLPNKSIKVVHDVSDRAPF